MIKNKFVLIFFNCVFLMSCSNKKDINKISISNKSNENISSIKLTICKKVINMSDLKIDTKTDVSYEVIGDCHYHFVIVFNSGKKLDKEIGYVTNGFSYEHEVTITNTELILGDLEVKK